MNKNILIVDDSESIRELVAKILEKAGYHVTKGDNGQDGYEKLLQLPDVSLVITDLFMPLMDGIDLIKKIRSSEDYQYVPILMLTTESNMSKKMEAKEAGATGWMVKPFDKDKLLKIVHKIIR